MRIEIPEKLDFLLTEKRRYKVLHGGRGGAKSQSIARALLFLASRAPLRIGCGREIQKSINESVHALLRNTAEEVGIAAQVHVTENAITHRKTGSLFTFHGLGGKTAENLKSLEGCDIFWVEEGQTISERTWQILGPTIRRPSSEIWCSMNPRLGSDPSYQRLVMHDDPGIHAVAINYWDNPWFTEELESERRRDKLRLDPETYANIWCGIPLEVLDGAIYARQMKHLSKAGRIGEVPVHSALPINTFWDLGTSVGNSTSIWLHQLVGQADRFVGFMSDTNTGLEEWWRRLETWRDEHGCGAPWGIHHLPHDGAQTLQGRRLTNRRQILEEVIAGHGSDSRSKVVVVSRTTDIGAAIDATRMRLGSAYFDADRCAKGLHALRTYRYEWIEAEKRYSTRPLHDDASNPADALRTWSTGYKPAGGPRAPDRQATASRSSRGSGQWVRGSY